MIIRVCLYGFVFFPFDSNMGLCDFIILQHDHDLRNERSFKKPVYVRLFSERAKLNPCPSLGSTIKQAKLKHNNVFVNKLEYETGFKYIYNILCLYVYVYRNILI